MKQPISRRRSGQSAVRQAHTQKADMSTSFFAPGIAIPSSSQPWLGVLQLGEQLLTADAGGEAGQEYARQQHELICQTAKKILNARIELWLARSVLPAFATKPSILGQPSDAFFLPRPEKNLMRRAMETQRLVVETSAADPTQASTTIHAALPLMTPGQGANEIFGVLSAQRPRKRPFSPEELALLQGLALQSALALGARRQAFTEERRVEQLALVRKVNAQVANVREVDEFARRVTELIQRSFNYYYVAIFTLEPGQEVLHLRAAARPKRLSENDPEIMEEMPLPALVIRIGEGMIGGVARDGEEILANEVEHEASYRFLEQLPETRAEVSLPLKIETRILGVLDVQSDQPGEFTDVDLLVLRALAMNISLALEGARLYNELHNRVDQLATISDVSRALTSILDQDKLLNEVVSLLQRRFGFSYIYIFSVHPGRRKIFFEAGSHSDSRKTKEAGYAIDLDEPDGIIPWVARHGDTVVCNDTNLEPRFHALEIPPDETRSEMAVPLTYGGEVLGVLDIQSESPDVFSVEDRFIFEALADSIAVALRNATLYRSEIWRRQVADSMREVASLLSADVGLPQMLDAILEELERSLPCDVVAIWLMDDNEEYPDEGEAGPSLHLAAVRGAQAGWLQLEGLSLEELGRQKIIEQRIGHTPSLLIEALERNQPVIRTEHSAVEPLGAVLGYGPYYSAITAPLRVGEQGLGVLALIHHTPGRYGSEARGMVAAFASYAAVAIQNARLYEAAHDQAWVSTALLQVAQATQTIINLNELLTTVSRITPMLVGVKACAIYLYDENGVFSPVSAAGLSSTGLAEFERWRFAFGDSPALDQLLSERSPVVLPSIDGGSRLERIFRDEDESPTGPSAGVITLVPMLARGEVLGAFLIHYHLDSRDVIASENFFDETLLTLQGIAHQTAVAAENIRLLKTQKEEAYVSVALLQVAQAIVSSNDLDEILGSIVRITPILVGVRRTVLFVWDETRQVFWLSQEYGLPRGAEWSFYEPGEFPLLDAILEHDTLIALPMEIELADEDALEEWMELSAPDLDQIDEHLHGMQRLLLAFPLSIKGEILGVLLTEEPLVTPENLVGGTSFRRLREKRIEITTGISQQAALAIQNDRLQGEIVKRERLEREMQLAREIQYTFLPQRAPHLVGWDLSMRWRTAREVGGDFYDFFEIPARNGHQSRLGLVIADVADKGMPAALFMTLVRTLVRAAVQDLDEPAQVVKHVNTILLPDAKDGMFVTLVYAVVDLEKGTLTYANAGHNPPLLYRQTQATLEVLQRSGIALGVIETEDMGQFTLPMNPGDSVLFYTDGLSEAFSPTGEMFSDAQVAVTMQSAASDATRAAEGILDTIEAVLGQFVGDLPMADDLTLLCLRRTNHDSN